MSNLAAQQGVVITLTLDLKPDMAEMMRDGFTTALSETRAFPGCRTVHCYEDPTNPNRLILIENWDSQEDYGRYIQWRQENGMMDAMAEAMATPSAPNFWTFLC